MIFLCDWSQKPAPSSQPISCKTENNRNAVIRVFPRVKQLSCFCFEFSLADDNVNFVLIGRWHYFGFVFLRRSMKPALIMIIQTEKLYSKAMLSLVSPWVALISNLNAGLHGTIFARVHFITLVQSCFKGNLLW